MALDSDTLWTPVCGWTRRTDLYVEFYGCGPAAASGDRVAELHIALYHDLPSGGAKRTVLEQARGLVARGCTVHAFLPSTAEETFLPVDEAVHETRVFARRDPPDRERALTGPTPGLLLRWARFLAGVVRSEREIARAIDRGGFDVVLVHPSQFTQAPLVLRSLRTPAVYYCHEPLRAAYEPRIAPPWLRFLIRHTLGRVDRSAARKAAIIAANSAFTAEKVGAVYGREPLVLSPGVDPDWFRPLGQDRQEFVLAVGGLHPLKGFDFLLHGLAAVPDEVRPPLLIVSDRERRTERERLDRLARDLGVTVRYRVRIGEEELVRLYGAARALVVGAHGEPFGLVPLEAMACGTPVVAVAEGGLLETIDDGRTGLLTPRDPDIFAARLATLLDDPERAARMGAAGREAVLRHWTWARSNDRLYQLMHQTADPSTRHRAAP